MNLNKIISIIRSLNEESGFGGPTNAASGGAIAGLPPDQPPVYKNKKPKILARGLMPGARKRWSEENVQSKHR